MEKRDLISIILLFTLLIGCTTGHEKRAEYMETSQYQEANKYLEEKRKDLTIYYGEGIVEIGNNYAEARKEARQQALGSLSSQIEVAVESDLEVILTGSRRESGKEYNEEIKETVTNKTQTYTDQVLSNIKGNKEFIDYPFPGYITYFVYIDKAEYEEKVQKDLADKKNMLKSMFNSAEKELSNDNYSQALQTYGNTYGRIVDFFSNMPVELDTNEDGSTENLSVTITERVGNILTSLDLRGGDTRYTYDASGRLNTNPVVTLTYQEEKDKTVPVKSFPLTVNFIEGDARLPSSLFTGRYGQLELQIRDIDATKNKTSLVIEPDISEFPSLSEINLPHLPRLVITLEKLKTVIVSFVFVNNENVTIPRDMNSSLKSITLGKSLSVIVKNIESKVPTTESLQDAAETNANYLAHVYLETVEPSSVGGYDNMFSASGSGNISIYSLPRGDLIYSESVATVKGFGSTKEGVGWDALGKMRENVLSLYRKSLENAIK